MIKKIPNYSKYYISKDGEIYKKRKDKLVKLKATISKTSKGHYLAKAIYSDKHVKRFIGIHRLVCLTFNGPPPDDGLSYEPDHIDGDKLNNHYKNLEWVTRSENTFRALKSGLRNDNVVITVFDVIKNKKMVFYSIIETSRVLKMNRGVLISCLKKHEVTPYKKRYTFKVDINSFNKVVRRRVPIMIYDYINKTWLATESINIASIYTGVDASIIKTKLKTNKIFIGYLFTKGKPDNGLLKEVDLNKCINERNEYLRKTM